MSTYISGYIMKSISLKELIAFNIKHKLELDIIKKKYIRKKLIRYFIKEYDEMTFNIFKKSNNIGKNILDTIIDEIKYELSNPTAKGYNKYHDINFSAKLVYYHLNNNKILVKPNNMFEEALKYINNIKEFSDYSYQNSTDKPSDVSTKNWNKRIKDWDIVWNNDICKNGYGNINGGGLLYELCDNEINYTDCKLDIDLLEYINPIDIRCKKIASDLFIDYYFDKNISKESDIEVSDYTRCFFKVNDLIRNNDSEYLKIYDEVLPKLHDIDIETIKNAVYII